MIRFLARRLIRDYDNVGDAVVRRAYGVLCGAVGIALNLLLFVGKLLPTRSITSPTRAPQW